MADGGEGEIFAGLALMERSTVYPLGGHWHYPGTKSPLCPLIGPYPPWHPKIPFTTYGVPFSCLFLQWLGPSQPPHPCLLCVLLN